MKHSSIKPVSHDTLREKVYHEVREALMAGKFKPGEVLRLQAVANAVGTSLMPVREALRRLVAEQALVATANRAMIVPFPTERQFRDILETRLRLEPYAASLAAHNITPKQLEAAQVLTRRMENTSKTSDYLRLNQQFHFAIYRASERPIMLSLIESLWLHIGPLLNHLLGSGTRFAPGKSNRTTVAEHHEAILHGLIERDPAVTADAIADDISTAGETIMKMLRELQSSEEADSGKRKVGR